MINYEKKLRKENNLLGAQLTEENDEILTNMLVYIQSSNLCAYDIQVIHKELLGMALEAQLRGEALNQVFGENYQELCDELIKEGRKKTWYEKGLEIASIITAASGTIWIAGTVIDFIFEVVEKGFNSLYFEKNFTLGTAIIIFISVVAAYTLVIYAAKNAFEFDIPDKKSKKPLILFSIYYTFIIGIMIAMHFLFGKVILFRIHVIYGTMALILLWFTIKIAAAKHSKHLAQTHK